MVKRYDPISKGEFTVVEDGPFVEYSDYAALQAENERLKAERVDLEQFREAVIALRSAGRNRADQGYDRIGPDGLREAAATIAEADHLLALIDASKSGEVKP